MVDKATDYPGRFQWEASSGSMYLSQAYNCGPTGAAQQIDYYMGRPGTTQIEKLRTVAGVPRGVPTSAWQQAQMLTAMGVPAQVVEVQSMDQLDRMLGWGDRPIGIGVLMSRLRASTRGHTFLGWHRLTLLRKSSRKVQGVRRRGYIYTDPNFRPAGTGYREDPMKGKRFINRRELERAFIDHSPSYAIVPLYRKR